MQNLVSKAARAFAVAGLVASPAFSTFEDPALIESEKPIIEAMAKQIAGSIEKAMASGERGTRDAHAKANGCIAGAYLTVKPDLAPELQVGLFENVGETFEVILRNSNGSGDVHVSDSAGGAQGLAVKVLLDKHPKIAERLLPLEGELNVAHPKYYKTQDFLAINRVREFFVDSVADYPVFVRAKAQADAAAKAALAAGKTPEEAKAAAGTILKEQFIFPAGGPDRRPAGAVLAKLGAIQTKNPLAETYHSMVPSLFGEKNAVKYRLSPCQEVDPNAYVFPEGLGPATFPHTFLHEVLKHELRAQESCYALSVILHTPQMPSVEKASLPWSTDDSAYVELARIKVTKKTEGRELVGADFCEKLAFTPWHTLPEHRPIGGVQRARKAIYVATANARNKKKQ